MKNEGARVLTTLYIDFSNAQGQITRIWQKFKLIQAFLVVLVTCKNEKDSIKNESTRELTIFLPL